MQDIEKIYQEYANMLYKYVFCLTGKEDSIIEEKIYKNQDKIQLFKNIQKLDEDTKNVIYLRILGNLTYKEIAEVMGKSENWARVIFFRGKQKLQNGEI